MRLVRAYTHLGFRTTAGKSWAPEVAARASAANAATAALAARVLRNAHMSRQVRVQICSACVFSRLFVGAGAWGELSGHHVSRLCAAFYRPLHIISAPRRAHGPAPDRRDWLSHVQAASRLPVPTFPCWLAAARLRYAARVSLSGGSGLIAVLRAEGSQPWKRELTQSLEFARALLPDKLGALPPAASHPEVWEQLWSEFPGEWKAIVRFFFFARAAADPARAHQLAQTLLPNSCHSGPVADEEWFCAECGRDFVTLSSLSHHRAKVHAPRRPARDVCSGSWCPNCGKNFHTRLRVMKHLERGSRACQLALREGRLPRLPDHVIQEADARDRALMVELRKHGRFDNAGPPFRPAPCPPPAPATAPALANAEVPDV